MSWSTSATVRVARGILNIGLIATIVGAIVVGLQFERAGGRLLSVQTASMVPTFRPGDVLIVSPAVAGSLRVGDIITYRSPRDQALPISHRLVAIRGGQLYTRGDARQAIDQAITPQAVIGRARAVAPGLGRLVTWLRRPIGLALALYLPAVLVIVQQIRQIRRPGIYRLAR